MAVLACVLSLGAASCSSGSDDIDIAGSGTTATSALPGTTTAPATTATTVAPTTPTTAPPPKIEWTSAGVNLLPWGLDRDQAVFTVSALMGHGPDESYDDLGAECGPVTGSARIWREPFIYLGFDLDHHLGSVSFDLGVVPHARGLHAGDSIDQLRSAEPTAAIEGPIPELGSGTGEYYDWTVTNGDVSAQGTLSGPPPNGRVDSTVHLAAPNDPQSCGE